MLISSSRALLQSTSYASVRTTPLQRRSLACTCPLSWKRKSASLGAIPLKIKAKNLKSASSRWTVLEGERFLRARSNMQHGVTRMQLRAQAGLRGYKLAEPEHIRPLKRLMPYYRKLIRRQSVD